MNRLLIDAEIPYLLEKTHIINRFPGEFKDLDNDEKFAFQFEHFKAVANYYKPIFSHHNFVITEVEDVIGQNICFINKEEGISVKAIFRCLNKSRIECEYQMCDHYKLIGRLAIWDKLNNELAYETFEDFFYQTAKTAIALAPKCFEGASR